MIDYIEYLHRSSINSKKNRNKYIAVGILDKKGKSDMKEEFIRVSDINNDFLNKLQVDRNKDYYVSSSVFNGKSRRRTGLNSIENIIIDIDNHKNKNYDRIRYFVDLFIENIPENLKPSARVDSGRGIQLVYKINMVSYKRLSCVSAITCGIIHELNKVINKLKKQWNVSDDDFLSIDNSASTNFSGYFRLPNTFNSVCGTFVTWKDYGRKYTVDYLLNNVVNNRNINTSTNNKGKSNKNKFNNSFKRCNRIVYTEDIITLPKTDVTHLPSSVKTIILNRLMNKRLSFIKYLIDKNNTQHIVDGFRNPLLLIAYACYYTLNPDTAEKEIFKLNSTLSQPLDNKELNNIKRYVDAQGGLKYTDEHFLYILNCDKEEQEEYHKTLLKRNRKKVDLEVKQGNEELLIEDYKNGVSIPELIQKYNVCRTKVYNITKPVRDEMKNNSIQEVKSQIKDSSIKEISKNSHKSISTIKRWLKKDCSKVQKSTNPLKYKKEEFIVQDEEVVMSVGENDCITLDAFDLDLEDFEDIGCDSNPLTSQDKMVLDNLYGCCGVGDDDYVGKMTYSEYENMLRDLCDLFSDDEDESFTVNNDNGVDSSISYQFECVKSMSRDNYTHLFRFLNRSDLGVLKILYAYAVARYGDSWNFKGKPISISMDMIRYFGLGLNRNFIPFRYSKYDKDFTISSIKRFIKSNVLDTDIFSVYGCVWKGEDKYAYADEKQIRVSLRKLIYLGFIDCAPKKDGVKSSQFILHEVNLDVANSKAKEWYDGGLVASYISDDNYIYNNLSMGDYYRVSSVRCYVNKFTIANVVQQIRCILNKNMVLWKDFSKEQKEIFVKYHDMFLEYTLVTVNKDILSKLSTYGLSDNIHVGSKILLNNLVLNV